LAAPSFRQDASVGLVLGSVGGIVPGRAFPPFERSEGYEGNSHTPELADLAAEGIRGKRNLLDERQLEAYPVALVPGPALLVRLGCVSPPVAAQQRRDAFVIRERHGDVDVVVLPRHCTRVEVDRPAAEEPVVDPLSRQELVDARERGELGY
jgi:hypothetical protein